MMKHLILILLLAHDAFGQRSIATFPAIAGAQVSPTDRIIMLDVSAADPKGRYITFAELVNVPGLFEGSGSTDLTYTASSRLLESSTGTDATLPLFTTGAAGLVPASGGGTTNFLRADGSWAAASGSGIGDFLADGSVPMTGDLNLNGNDITGINTFTTAALNTTNFQISSTAITATAVELNFVDGVTSNVQTQLDAKAPNTGTLTGTHTTPSIANPLAPTWTGPMHVVFYGATGEIDLPAAAGYAGRGIAVYNTGAFTVSIDPNASEVIVRDGTVQTGGVTMTLSSGAGNFVTLLSDGTRWVTFGFKGTLGAGS